MQANGRPSLKVPTSPFIPSGLISVNARGADIDKIAGKGTFKWPVAEPTKVHAIGYLHCTQVSITCKILIKSPAPKTVDTAVHFMLD
jgi:hypothetical protein